MVLGPDLLLYDSQRFFHIRSALICIPTFSAENEEMKRGPDEKGFEITIESIDCNYVTTEKRNICVSPDAKLRGA